MRPHPPTIATLVYDSECGPRRRPARSLVRWRRRLVYRAGTVEIDLEIGPSRADGYLRVLGQVMTGESSLAQARVTTDGLTGRLRVEAATSASSCSVDSSRPTTESRSRSPTG